MLFKDLKPGQFFKLLDDQGMPYRSVWLKVVGNIRRPDRWGGGDAINVGGHISGYFSDDDPVKLVNAIFVEADGVQASGVDEMARQVGR